MKYSKARPKIRSGDLLAWSHREPFWKSWRSFKIAMVRMFTMSEYSHVGTAWVQGGRVWVIEAVMPTVRTHMLSNLGEFYWIPLNADWSRSTEEFALSKVDQPYSQWQAMQAFFRLPKDDGLWECAELVRAIAAKDGINLGHKATPTSVVRHACLNGAVISMVTPDAP